MNHRVKGCMEIPRCILMGRGRVLFLHVYLLPQNVNVSVARSTVNHMDVSSALEKAECHSRLPFLYC